MLNSDLNWLPTSLFKGITYPKIIWEEFNNQNYSGYFEHETNLLTIVLYGEELIPSTIAHELCHYIQQCEGRLPSTDIDFNSEDNYEQAIYNYFQVSHEYEALLFEYKHSKSWLNDWWLNKLVHKN